MSALETANGSEMVQTLGINGYVIAVKTINIKLSWLIPGPTNFNFHKLIVQQLLLSASIIII